MLDRPRKGGDAWVDIRPSVLGGHIPARLLAARLDGGTSKLVKGEAQRLDILLLINPVAVEKPKNMPRTHGNMIVRYILEDLVIT